MKIVIVEESAAEAGVLGVLVPEKELWAFQVLLARAGKKAVKVSDLDESVAAVRKEYSHAS
jgi:hypothetical protein